MFNKRSRSLFKNANEIPMKTITELYLVMHRRGAVLYLYFYGQARVATQGD